MPQLTLDARSASIARGDLSVKSAEATASVPDYLVTPAISGKVRALSVVSGSTSVSDVDVALTRDGDWTGFNGGATVNDIVARAAGRVKIAQGATTIELASGTATTRGVTAKLARATTVVIKGGETTLDRLALGVGGGSVQVTGTAGQALNLDIQISALPATRRQCLRARSRRGGSDLRHGPHFRRRRQAGHRLLRSSWKDAQTTQTRVGRLRRDEHQLDRHSGGRRAEFTANVGDGSGLGMKGGGTVDTGRRTLSLDFSGGVPFSFLTKRLAAQGLSLSGTSNVSLALRGSIAAPVVSGKVTASGARLVDARSGLAVNGIAADIAIAGGVATVRR